MKKKPDLLRPFMNTFNYFIGMIIFGTLALIFGTISPFRGLLRFDVTVAFVKVIMKIFWSLVCEVR